MTLDPVIGRFAPTPSGPLHFGSLVTAVASYCEVRSQHGKWLLRIEDVDTPRNVTGSAKQIISTLEIFGFEWDDEIEYQSKQFGHYQQVLQSLVDRKLGFACECSRRSLREANALTGPLGLIYPGLCRGKKLTTDNHSIRIDTRASGIVDFTDQTYGLVTFDIEQQLGDFVLRRADGVFAYHLAVVIDDERQGINQIVRGADLLEATCLHIYLQKILGFKQPDYRHIPLVRNAQGDKLSKQTGATAIDSEKKVRLLIDALKTLGQPVQADMQQATVKEILASATKTWDSTKIPVPSGSIY